MTQKINPPVATEYPNQKAIIEYLWYEPRVAWFARVNSGMFTGAGGGMYQMVRVYSRSFIIGKVKPKMPDIIGQLKDGTTFAIEVKKKGKRPSPGQQGFLNAVAVHNGIAVRAYSVDDVVEAFQDR